MPSTFFGLTIASSGLNAYQVALNTTANNISNVQTKGYSKQQANRVASDALRVYQKYGAVGTGVTTTSVKQLRNQYYDLKYSENQSSVGLYETKLNYMQQIENYYMDDDYYHMKQTQNRYYHKYMLVTKYLFLHLIFLVQDRF